MTLATPIPPVTEPPVAFFPMVEACASHGIARTVAFALARDGLLETFRIGRRRYVMLQSIHDLPQRLLERGSDVRAVQDGRIAVPAPSMERR